MQNRCKRSHNEGLIVGAAPEFSYNNETTNHSIPEKCIMPNQSNGDSPQESNNQHDEKTLREAFLATTRHDLCTPINAIIGYSEMLWEDAEEADLGDVLQDLAKIKNAGHSLLARVLELLNPELIQSGNIDLTNMEALGERVHCALRGDINTVVGYCEMLIEEMDDQSVVDDLTKIRVSASKLVDLLQGIVNYAGVVSGPESFASEAPSNNSRITEMAENLRNFDARNSRDAEAPGSLLVVDDNELNRDILARQLSRDGHEVSLATGGREALQHLEDHDVELVLLDLFMPDIDGYEVLERMKADPRWQQIPVIVLSAGGNTDSFVRCIEAGAEDYLAKPANPVLLRSRTMASLERKRLRDREKEYLEQIRIERDKSDKLLLNILPVPIAERLKAGEQTIADAASSATVLFCDVVGFTTMSARLAPEVIVQRLNKVFRAFDALAEKHGVEKIKTIGDAYMAVAGVPVAVEDHARRITDMAIDMLVAVDTYSREESEPLQVRIGINSGPVVAGVIGTAKFAYDLWGDTVNTASRMESSGEPGRIQVSASTREQLGNHCKLLERGTIEVKGKGPMTTYFIEIIPKPAS